jgi:HK97 family phage prohead protease
MIELKSLPSYNVKVDGNNREVAGIFAVHGNLDSYRDVSHPGSFTKTINERASRVKFLWNHDFMGGPPTAKIIGIKEIIAEDLPQQVRDLAPGATGGVEVRREYMENSRAEEVYEAVVKGASDEMSYAYEAVRVETERADDEPPIRHLREVKLFEISDVIFGANPATSGMKQNGFAEQTAVAYLAWYLKTGNEIPEQLIKSISMDNLFTRLDEWLAEIKAGRRNASSDAARIDQIALLAYELGATNVKLLEDDEDAEADEDADKAIEIPGEIPETKDGEDAETAVETEAGEEPVSDESEVEDTAEIDEPEDEQRRAGADEADDDEDADSEPPLTLELSRLEELELDMFLGELT